MTTSIPKQGKNTQEVKKNLFHYNLLFINSFVAVVVQKFTNPSPVQGKHWKLHTQAHYEMKIIANIPIQFQNTQEVKKNLFLQSSFLSRVTVVQKFMKSSTLQGKH